MNQVKFGRYNCEVRKTKYQGNNRLCLVLYDSDDGGIVTKATTNIPEVTLKENEVLIKNYSENEGLLFVLEKANVVRWTGRNIQSGYTNIPICEVLI